MGAEQGSERSNIYRNACSTARACRHSAQLMSQPTVRLHWYAAEMCFRIRMRYDTYSITFLLMLRTPLYEEWEEPAEMHLLTWRWLNRHCVHDSLME